jgi:hypothetical protein
LCLGKKKTKNRKKRGSSSFPSIDTWPWCPISNKKNEKRGSLLPFLAPSLLNLGDDALEATKRTKEKREQAPPLSRPGNGT